MILSILRSQKKPTWCVCQYNQCYILSNWIADKDQSATVFVLLPNRLKIVCKHSVSNFVLFFSDWSRSASVVGWPTLLPGGHGKVSTFLLWNKNFCVSWSMCRLHNRTSISTDLKPVLISTVYVDCCVTSRVWKVLWGCCGSRLTFSFSCKVVISVMMLWHKPGSGTFSGNHSLCNSFLGCSVVSAVYPLCFC